MAKYQCTVCGYVYDEEEGDSESNVPPNTLWDDLPEEWVCPVCGAKKEEFELLE
jgi:rubredoxin